MQRFLVRFLFQKNVNIIQKLSEVYISFKQTQHVHAKQYHNSQPCKHNASMYLLQAGRAIYTDGIKVTGLLIMSGIYIIKTV